MENKNIFITGATGFIGGRLALRLVEKNQVFALVRAESSEKANNLRQKGVHIVTGDLLNPDTYSGRLDGIDYIFHLAALFKIDAPKKELNKHNVIGTRSLLETCLGKNIKKIVCFSTAYVAGTKEKDSISEDEPYPSRFKNWYEWSKAQAEKVVLDFYKKHNLPAIIVRPAIVYGPGSRYGFADALFLISRGKLFLRPGNGRNRIHLVHVDDVIGATLHLSELKDMAGQIYNIADNHAHTCRHMVDFICRSFGVSPPKIAVPRFAAKAISKTQAWKWMFKGVSSELLDYFLYNQTYSNSKIKSTGYLFKYGDPLIGLESTIEWYKNVLS